MLAHVHLRLLQLPQLLQLLQRLRLLQRLQLLRREAFAPSGGPWLRLRMRIGPKDRARWHTVP